MNNTVLAFFQLPVVITDSNIVAPALKWTLGYLQKYLGDNKHYVYVSKDDRFKVQSLCVCMLLGMLC